MGSGTRLPPPPGKRADRTRGLLTFSAVGLAVALALVLSRWHKRGAVATTAIRNRSRTRRLGEVARLGAKVGTARTTTSARKLFASAERQIELDEALQLRTAHEVAESLGNMKGAMMKLAQMAGFVDDGLPEPMRLALSQLQSNAPPMSADLVNEVVERELGRPPQQIFLEWDEQPLAAASIGQVHRAIWLDPSSGRERAVAVKVQYPGVAEAIRADLDNTAMIGTLLGIVYRGLDPEPLVRELRARIGEELDYRNEAANQTMFADWYDGHPFIRVPRVVPLLSTGLVLTSELADGVSFAEMLTWGQDARNLAGEAIFRFVFRSLYRFGSFNGDPHPGNYLFGRDGTVTFLDFGLVKHFTTPELELFMTMIGAAVLDGDWDRYRRILEGIGLLTKNAPVTTDEACNYFALFYEALLPDKDITWTSEYSSRVTRNLFDRSSPIAQYATVPESFVVIQRINIGLFGVLGQLQATGNYRRISEELWPMTNGLPSTPMGEAEAEWLRRRAGEP